MVKCGFVESQIVRRTLHKNVAGQTIVILIPLRVQCNRVTKIFRDSAIPCEYSRDHDLLFPVSKIVREVLRGPLFLLYYPQHADDGPPRADRHGSEIGGFQLHFASHWGTWNGSTSSAQHANWRVGCSAGAEHDFGIGEIYLPANFLLLLSVSFQVKLLHKQGTITPRKTKPPSQPFETTFRLQVNVFLKKNRDLPRTFLYHFISAIVYQA